MKNNQMTIIVSSILLSISMIVLHNTMSSMKMVTDIMAMSVVSVVNYYKQDKENIMKAYHNKGFGMAFFVVFLLLIPLPILGLWAVDGQDWVDRFTTKYFSPWQSECWETAKHERVCKGDNQCKWFRNFCHD
jgi:hypothetical protein